MWSNEVKLVELDISGVQHSPRHDGRDPRQISPCRIFVKGAIIEQIMKYIYSDQGSF